MSTTKIRGAEVLGELRQARAAIARELRELRALKAFRRPFNCRHRWLIDSACTRAGQSYPPRVTVAHLEACARNAEAYARSPISAALPCGADDAAGENRDAAGIRARELRAAARALQAETK